MAHITKFTKGQVGAVLRHCERLNDNYTNENINRELTKENTYFVNGKCKTGQEYLSKRLSQLKVLNRKDVNVACSWVVTMPKDLPEEYGNEFFSYTFKFLTDRYKPENCISASLHIDEVTPHLHYIFVPEVNGRVCAKEVINRQELKIFHRELESYLEDKLGIPVGILNGATKNGNKTVEQLKEEEKLKAEIKRLKEENKDLKEDIEILHEIYGFKDNAIRQAKFNILKWEKIQSRQKTKEKLKKREKEYER